MAATAVVVLTAAASPALATSSTAQGSATSSLRLLHVELAGHALSAGEVAAVADNTASPHVARIVITPAALDGHTYGQQTVTPASSPVTVPSTNQTATIPGGVASVTGPTFAVTVTDGTGGVITSAVLKALGTITVATLPVNLSAASLTANASVTSTQSTATKSVKIGDLSLPSISDLLNALNIDPQALFTSLTQQALNKFEALVSTNPLTALNSAVDGAQAADGGASAPNTTVAADAAATAAQAAATSADNADTAANAAFTQLLVDNSGSLPVGVTTALTPTQYEALNTTTKGLLDAAIPTLAAAATTALNADAAKAAADDAAAKAVALANALLALAVAVFDNVAANATPLASLADVNVTTKAVASMNSPAPVATANVGPLQVLGVSTSLAALTSTLNGVLTQLSSILNSVAGVSFTPPSVQVGVGTTSRSVNGSTHFANASISGVVVTLPKLTLPTALLGVGSAITPRSIAAKARTLSAASPRAAALTTIVTSGGSLSIATLSESASYTPAGATVSRPSSGKPGLAATGSTYTLPTVAAILVGSALVGIRRRRRVAEVRD